MERGNERVCNGLQGPQCRGKHVLHLILDGEGGLSPRVSATKCRCVLNTRNTMQAYRSGVTLKRLAIS